MTNKRTTKSALFASVIALFLCLTMLVGTTFAWFTDSVTSANNIIKSGNLDIELYYQLQDQTDWTKVTAETNVFKDALWEPGHTEVVKLKIVNEGSLALKYNLGVNVAAEIGSVNVEGESFLLSDYIKYGIVEGAQSYTRDAAIAAVDATATALKQSYTKANSLLATGESHVVTMVVYMPTTVGNEANYAKGAVAPTIHLGINLFATQKTYEEDSFGPDYDKAAPWTGEVDTSWYNASATEVTITTAEQLAGLAALVNGTAGVQDSFLNKTVKLGANLSLGGLRWTPIGTPANGFKGTFDGQGYTVSDFTVNETEYAGLFGYALNGGNIKNLTVKNATVSAVDRAAAILGAGYTDVVNCHAVDCEITVTPALQANGVYDGGAKAGGIVGQLFEGAGNTLVDCTATNVKVLGYRDIGGVLGMAHSNNVVTNCKATNSEVSYVYLDAGAAYEDNTPHENAGAVVGRISSTATVTGSVEENVETDSIYVYGLKLTRINGNNQCYGTITVSDKAGLLNLAKLAADWAVLFTDGNGTDYLNYPINNYYYDWTWSVVLTDDIDFGGATIQPIDLGKKSVFDGQGHTVKNAVIVADPTAENEAGLFDASECGVKNLKLDNIHVTGSNVGNSTAGILSGSCNKPIDNVTVTNSSVTGGKYTGGVIGYGYTTITNCTVENTTVKGGYKLGGVIGYICASDSGNDVMGNTLTDCTVDGIGGGVYAGGKTTYVVGKIVGNYNCNGYCANNTVTNMTTSATEDIGAIEAGKDVTQGTVTVVDNASDLQDAMNNTEDGTIVLGGDVDLNDLLGMLP